MTLRADGPGEEAVEAAAMAMAAKARILGEPHGIQVLGPAPQAIGRLRGRFRWHLLLKAPQGTGLREVAAAVLGDVDGALKSVRVIADVDPIEVL